MYPIITAINIPNCFINPLPKLFIISAITNVIDAISANGEKYVRSSPDDYTHDNLLSLPRE